MKKRNLSREKGQAFVELGISMVFLLILMAGVMDLGRTIFTYIAIRDAVQEGASFGAIDPANCTGIENRIIDHTEGAIELDNVDITIEIDGVSCASATGIAPGDTLRVALVFSDFQIATPFIGAIIGTQSFDLQAEVTETILRVP